MAVLDYVSGTLESARRQADRVVTPEARQKASNNVQSFAHERPLLFSFIVAQTIFALVPILFFGSFVLGTLSVAFVSALLFSLFWVGIAALVLGSTLFVTSGLALFAWVWFLGAYTAANFVYGLVAGSPKTQQELTLRGSWAPAVKKEPQTNGSGLENYDGKNHASAGVGDRKRGDGGS